jgi:hypothetical protein
MKRQEQILEEAAGRWLRRGNRVCVGGGAEQLGLVGEQHAIEQFGHEQEELQHHAQEQAYEEDEIQGADNRRLMPSVPAQIPGSFNPRTLHEWRRDWEMGCHDRERIAEVQADNGWQNKTDSGFASSDQAGTGDRTTTTF